MPFRQTDSIRYFQFETLPAKHAIFTRQGGTSPAPWSSLNVGGTVGDDLQRVRTNRDRSIQALGRSPDSIFDVWQVHSADAICATAPRPLGRDFPLNLENVCARVNPRPNAFREPETGCRIPARV